MTLSERLAAERRAAAAVSQELLDALRAFCGDHEATGMACAGLNAAYLHAKTVLAKHDGERWLIRWCVSCATDVRVPEAAHERRCPRCGRKFSGLPAPAMSRDGMIE